jgi:two-component system sensor histidine kinase/response regulator
MDLHNWQPERFGIDYARRTVETKTALYECEGLRHQLQEEIGIRKEVQQHLQKMTNAFLQRTLQLQARSDELEKRNLELDSFAHTVAHDLKNPISGIVNLSELLLERSGSNQLLDNKSLKLLQLLNRAGQQAFDTIEALLLLAGVSRKGEVRISQLKMSDIVAKVIQQRLADMIEQYHAQIEIPQSWPMAQGYGPWVEEIWANYLSNGLKYGGQPPHVQLGADSEKEGMVRFWVRDNGTGLTEEQQAQLFTPFTRLHSHAPGHGLGLSIVQKIVEKLGGQAGVESVVGQGSLFYFTLPVSS